MAALPMPKSESEFKEWLLELIRTLVAIVGQKEPLLRNHCKRVANNCANFCEEFKLLKEDEIFNLYLAGLLHDFGLIFFRTHFSKILKNEPMTKKSRSESTPVLVKKFFPT